MILLLQIFKEGTGSSNEGKKLLERVNRMTDPTKLIEATVTMKNTKDDTTNHSKYTIATITTMKFKSEKGKTVTMSFNGSSWSLDKEE